MIFINFQVYHRNEKNFESSYGLGRSCVNLQHFRSRSLAVISLLLFWTVDLFSSSRDGGSSAFLRNCAVTKAIPTTTFPTSGFHFMESIYW